VRCLIGHGIINYSLGLVESLDRLVDASEELSIVASRSIARELIVSDRASVRTIRDPRSPVDRLARDASVNRFRPRRQKALLHLPKGLLTAPMPGSPLVVTIHDDIPFLYVDGTFPASRQVRAKAQVVTRLIRHAAAAATSVLTVSQFSATQLQRRLKLSPEQLTVTGQGLRPIERPVSGQATKREVVVHLSSRHAHKGTRELMEWYARRSLRMQEALPLLLIGPLPDGVIAAPPVIHLPGPLSSRELHVLIASARAVLVNSRYEGYGLAPLEALASGTPAVFTSIDPHVENVGATSTSFAPGDEEGFNAALDAALRLSEDEMAVLRADVEQRFHWDIAGAATLDAYRSAFAR
jgi:glycosyltransferase involved in cell wall biosynthesis